MLKAASPIYVPNNSLYWPALQPGDYGTLICYKDNNIYILITIKFQSMNITLAQAEVVITAAKKKADQLKTKMNICVVDTGSNLVGFARMDGAWIGSVDIATKKAKTANWFMMDTAALSPLVQPGQPLFNIEHSNGGLITFPGGVVIKNKEGEIIGAVGVSGSTVDHDHAVAEAGAAAVK